LPVGVVGIVAYGMMLYFIDRSIPARPQRAMFRAGASLVGNFLLVFAFMRLTPEAASNALKLNINQIAVLIGVILNFLAFLYFTDGLLPGHFRPYWRYLSAAGCAGLFFWALHEYVPDHAKCVEISKAAIAIVAAAFVFFETHRKGQGRPLAERWKKIVGV